MSQTILISAARSGTNYFLDVYGKCFPKDLVLREIFRSAGDSMAALESCLELPADEISRLRNDAPVDLWNALKDRMDSSAGSLIAKIFYYHKTPTDDLWADFIATSKIVHLIRGNIFDTYVSMRLADATGQWQLRGKAEAAPVVDTFNIDPDEYAKYLDKRVQQIEWARKTFSSQDYHEVFYEDISSDSRLCVEAIGVMYGHDFSDFESTINIRKQKQRSNAELIENYDELAELDCRTY